MEKKHLNKILSIKLFRILRDVNIGVVYSPIKHLGTRCYMWGDLLYDIQSRLESVLFISCCTMLFHAWGDLEWVSIGSEWLPLHCVFISSRIHLYGRYVYLKAKTWKGNSTSKRALILCKLPVLWLIKYFTRTAKIFGYNYLGIYPNIFFTHQRLDSCSLHACTSITLVFKVF